MVFVFCCFTSACIIFFFFSSRRRHTRSRCDWSSDVCSSDLGMTVIFVEHDMDVVRDISDWVVVMAAGQIIAEGPPESISQNQAVVDAYLGAHDDAPLTVEEEDRVLAEAQAKISRQEQGDPPSGSDVISSDGPGGQR